MFKLDTSGSPMYLGPLRQVKSQSFPTCKMLSEKKPEVFLNVKDSHNCVSHILSMLSTVIPSL